ncbi:MAG: hypothetical protein R3A79_17610 [Nannocystaceae bacterium]
MARWLVVVGVLAFAGCSSSDLDDLCKRAGELSERRDEPATKRVQELFEGWEPSSKQGKEIRAQMIRDGEIASYGVFRKLISSKASTAWQCPAVERLMVEPVVADADQLCIAAGKVPASDIDSKSLAAQITKNWTPTSTWGSIVHDGMRAAPIEEVVERVAKSYAAETGKEWSCPGLAEAVRSAKRNDLKGWCDLAEMVAKSPTGTRPTHLRRAKMQQLTGQSLGFSLEELHKTQESVGAPRCLALEQVLGLSEEGRAIEAVADTTGGETDGE